MRTEKLERLPMPHGDEFVPVEIGKCSAEMY